MRVSVPKHHLSLELDDRWTPDPTQPGTEHLGLYVRSNDHGIYLNVVEYGAGDHELTQAGLLALLREQNWGAAIDEWSATSNALTLVGGSFETAGMGGEIVLEIFVTDGHRIANLAGPGPRQVIAALRPAAERLASTIRFD
jgi:hypothetical protein